jgi:hypothetical protein
LAEEAESLPRKELEKTEKKIETKEKARTRMDCPA